MGMEKKIHFAELNTISHIVRLIKDAKYDGTIRLAGHGEPTLHPKIAMIIRIIRANLPGTCIHMFTNGTVIEKKPGLVDELFKAGLNNLIVDEYSDHRVGEFIRSNDVCRKYKIVEQGAGTTLLDKKAKKRICIVPPIDGDKNTINRQLCNHLGAGLPPLKESLEARCSVVFRELTFRHDGTVAICCNDFRGLYRVTDAKQCSSLEQIWFHERMEAVRRITFEKNRKFYPCNLCDVKPNRPGLLPSMGKKESMEPPTEHDWEIVSKRYPSLSVVELRKWEK